jgi:hypothetical protein
MYNSQDDDGNHVALMEKCTSEHGEQVQLKLWNMQTERIPPRLLRMLHECAINLSPPQHSSSDSFDRQW